MVAGIACRTSAMTARMNENIASEVSGKWAETREHRTRRRRHGRTHFELLERRVLQVRDVVELVLDVQRPSLADTKTSGWCFHSSYLEKSGA